MTITITSTSRIIQLRTADGAVPARIWEGMTEDGIAVHAFITRIVPAIPIRDHRQKQFEAELVECAAPSADVAAYPARLIL